MKKANEENLNHPPSLPAKKSIWKRSKWGSIVATLFGIFVFSLLTIYIISETERNREHEKYVQAEEEIQAVYKEMEGNLQKTEDGQLLGEINVSKIKSVQSSLSKVEGTSKNEKEKLISMMKEIKIYNHAVPLVNELQNHINEVNKILTQSVFDNGLEEKIALLKTEMAEKLKEFDQIESASLKAFIGKYTAQVNTIEDEFKNYMGVQDDVIALKKVATEQSVGAEEFERKAEDVMSQVNRLSNKQMAVMMEDEINSAIANFQQLIAAAEEKKRKEEERLAQKRREEQAAKPTEVNSSGSVSEEEEGQHTDNPEDELYPLEFTMTGADGFTFKMSRDFDEYKAGKGYDDIARSYGGRFYYTPHSDMSYVIIGRKIIATVSLVSGAPLEYKDLFIDLMTYQSKKYTREEFAGIVETVIESGEPYKVEEGFAGELLSLENGILRYDCW